MGVQEPVEEAFVEVPATPPGVRDLDSEDDLYTKTNDDPVPSYKNDIFKGVLPVIPYKGVFDFLDVQDRWHLIPTTKKKSESCPSCVEDVKRDLKKLEEFVENYKNEREALKAENEDLKKEVEELKKLLKQKENGENNALKVSISNKAEARVDVLVKKNNFENTLNERNNVSTEKIFADSRNKHGINSFSISLGKENVREASKDTCDSKARKTVAQLRKEFFEKSFQSEQKTFTTRNFLEIKPEENKNTFRSHLTIRVQPKSRISEVISKLTSSSSKSKVIPETSPVTLFQRFEKTKVVWKNDLQERFVLQKAIK